MSQIFRGLVALEPLQIHYFFIYPSDSYITFPILLVW